MIGGRGRGLLSEKVAESSEVISSKECGAVVDQDAIRRPGSAEEYHCDSSVDELVSRITAITFPDEMEVESLGKEITNTINDEESLSDLINKLYENGLKKRDVTPVIAAVFGHTAQHLVGNVKMRNLLLKKLQTSYETREELEETDRTRFVTSSLFLGEIYHRCKNTNGSPIEVLAMPVVKYLLGILKPHLSADPGSDINEEMLVVAKELLQSGHTLFKFEQNGLIEIVIAVTEVLVRHRSCLSDVCQLNLLAALAELWPDVNAVRPPMGTHAALAAKLGLSLNV